MHAGQHDAVSGVDLVGIGGQVRVGDAASKAGLVAPVAEATMLSKPSTEPEPREAVGKPSTVVNDEWANTGRNEPCPCESGRKFKQCHGR